MATYRTLPEVWVSQAHYRNTITGIASYGPGQHRLPDLPDGWHEIPLGPDGYPVPGYWDFPGPFQREPLPAWADTHIREGGTSFQYGHNHIRDIEDLATDTGDYLNMAWQAFNTGHFREGLAWLWITDYLAVTHSGGSHTGVDNWESLGGEWVSISDTLNILAGKLEEIGDTQTETETSFTTIPRTLFYETIRTLRDTEERIDTYFQLWPHFS